MSRPPEKTGKRKGELIWQTVKSLARAPDNVEPEELNPHDTLSGFGLRRSLNSDGNHGYMEFALTSPYLTVMRSTFTTSKEQVSIATTERDVLRIRLALSGSVGYEEPEGGDRVILQAPSCLVVTQPTAAELKMVIPANENFNFVGFVIPRGVVVDTLGFDPSLLPESLRNFEADDTTPLTATQLTMTSELLSVATDVANCDFRGALLDQFLEAKVRETLCYLIAAMQPDSEADAADMEVRLSSRDRAALAEARAIVDGTYASPLPLNELARKVGLNRNKLCSGFRSSYGLSVHEYARELRLQKALELLRTGSISITEVAEKVGYGHSSTLTAAIKRRFGVSPRQLKR